MTIRPHLKGVAKTWLQSCAILQFCLIRRLEFAVSLVRYSAQAVPTPTGIKRDRIRYPLLLPFHSPLFPLLSPLRQTLLFCKQISRLNYTDILVLIPRSINLDCEILAWSNCRNPCIIFFFRYGASMMSSWYWVWGFPVLVGPSFSLDRVWVGSVAVAPVSDLRRMEPRVGDKFRLGRKIGSGSFGEIYLGLWPLSVSIFSQFGCYFVQIFPFFCCRNDKNLIVWGCCCCCYLLMQELISKQTKRLP